MIGLKNTDLLDNFETLRELVLASIFKCRLGKIIQFNATTQKASIELIDKPFIVREDESIIELEPITLFDVPLQSIKGAWGFINTPINVNDIVEVKFLDRDPTNWLITGNTITPPNTNMHDKNSCIFTLLSPSPNNTPIQNYDNDSFTIDKQDCGSIKLKNNIEIKHIQGGNIEIRNKIKISNNTQNLKNILNDFANAIKDAKVLNPLSGNFDLTLDPPTIASINNFISSINNLLE